MEDYLVRATAAQAQIRAFACTTRQTVEAARQAHNTSPVATAALGRLLAAGCMMGSMLKGEKDLLTLQISADGPMESATVTADTAGNVKGYVGNPMVILPANALTYYFAASEQVPSCVGLGVLMEKDNTVRQAGGFIVQLMPFAEDAVIDRLEENLKEIQSVTALLEQGDTPRQILEKVLAGLEVVFTDTMPVRFLCSCSKERVEKALISLGRSQLQELIDEGEEIEVNCHFCGKKYTFSIDELKRLKEK